MDTATRTLPLRCASSTARWMVAVWLLVACSSGGGEGPADAPRGASGAGGGAGGSASMPEADAATEPEGAAPDAVGGGGGVAGASSTSDARDAAGAERLDGGTSRGGSGGGGAIEGGRIDGARAGGGAGNAAPDAGAKGDDSGAVPREAGASSAYDPCPPSGRDCSVMPLGDSITDGFTVRGGYRIPFFQGAHREGKQFTFVGSAVNGPTTVDGVPFPQHHEGHSAHTMYDAPNAPIPRLGIARYIPTSIPQFHPDIVLLMIGTNDVDGNVDLPNAPSRLGMLIDSIIALDAHSLIVVAQITPTMQDPLNQTIVMFNAGIPAVVKSRADAGKHVVMVDMYNAFAKDPAYKTKYLADRLHPNAAGYQVMSDVWNSVVHDLIR